MTQSEYMNKINSAFKTYIMNNASIFDAYCYRDHRACDYIKYFKNAVERLGLKFSNCYNANGIGNNNEYKIYLEEIDKDGFIVQKNVAEFYYCYGIYSGCFASITDVVTGKKLKVSNAR